MIYIENEGAIFQGSSVPHPDKVWDHRKKEWKAYSGSVPKPIEWGREISQAEAEEFMALD